MAKNHTTFKDYKEALKWIGAILAVMVLYAVSMVIYERTLVEWWEPLGMALLAALGLWFPLRSRLTRLWKGTSVYGILLGHMVFMTGAALLLILGLNIGLADDATLHSEQVTVESREMETHYHSQRVGRGRYRRGNPYYKYILHVRFENGREKDLEVSLQRYNRCRTGSTLSLNLERGLWGWPVVTTRL